MVSAAVQKLLVKSPDDVVITYAKRSPLCRAKKGGFKEMQTDELLLAFLQPMVAELGINPALIGDIAVGNTLAPGIAYFARGAALTAGIPDTTPIQIINRFCSSGLMAVSIIANQVARGEIDVGLALGLESMSAAPDRGPTTFSPELLVNQQSKDCLQPMGWTSENVSRDFNISRERMDELAALSHQRAEAAQKSGKFAAEIVPINAWQTPTGGKERVRVVVKDDDGIRMGTTKESLSKIRAAFPQYAEGGRATTTTGGNASQVTDGVAGVLLMKRSKAHELGLTILAKHVATTVVGLAPRIMGIGPAIAIPKLLTRLNLTKEDIDLFEINEAFASMYAYCIDIAGYPIEKTNVNGSSIAIGHPLGCTGARQIATVLNEAKRRGSKIIITSMCIGSGEGAAACFVAEH